jgi:hypothetical protein
LRWTAKTLTDRAPNAQEKTYGADFCGVLDIARPDYNVKKGFLAQANLIEPGAWIRTDEFERMQRQCHNMLSISPESYVFLYSKEDIRVVPAVLVISSPTRNRMTSIPGMSHVCMKSTLSALLATTNQCFED